MRGRGSPKFQYSSRRPLRTKRGVPHREKFVWESALQLPEKKIGCDKDDFGVPTTFPLRSVRQRLDCSTQKISSRKRNLPLPRKPQNESTHSQLEFSSVPAPRSPVPERHRQPAGHLNRRIGASPEGTSLTIYAATRARSHKHARNPAPVTYAQTRPFLHDPAQHSAHDSAQDSPNELSGDDRGQPTITRKTSSTKSAMAMSLKRVAWGRAGQNWLAAQKRKAAASKIALANSKALGRRAIR